MAITRWNVFLKNVNVFQDSKETTPSIAPPPEGRTDVKSEKGTHFSEKIPYAFETSPNSHRTNEEALKTLKIFLARLGTTNIDHIKEEDHQLLLDYVIDIHLSITWYEKARYNEMNKRLGFRISTIILLFLIPVAIYYFTKNGSTTEQITAVLAGIIGVHRSLSAWLEKRNLIALFWKASSELKELLYTLEDKWREKSKENGHNTDFKLPSGLINDLRADIVKARKIVKNERDKFFENYVSGQIDLGDTLKSSIADAKTIVKSFKTPPPIMQAPKPLTVEITQKVLCTEAKSIEVLLNSNFSGRDWIRGDVDRNWQVELGMDIVKFKLGFGNNAFATDALGDEKTIFLKDLIDILDSKSSISVADDNLVLCIHNSDIFKFKEGIKTTDKSSY